MPDRIQPVEAGTPWGLGVTCDGPGCRTRFVGDFIVPMDSSRSVRLHKRYKTAHRPTTRRQVRAA